MKPGFYVGNHYSPLVTGHSTEASMWIKYPNGKIEYFSIVANKWATWTLGEEMTAVFKLEFMGEL